MLPQFTFAKTDYRPSRIFWWVILLLLGVAWLGIIGLDRDAMWYDEIYSYIYAGGEQYGPIGAGEVLTRVIGQLQHEKNPPGYYLLLHYWLGVAGSSAVAGRMLSLLFGMLSVVMTYRLGRDYAAWAGIRSAALVGLGAAVAVGASAYYIYYLHELRVYTLIVACVAFEVWAYLKLVRKPELNPRDAESAEEDRGIQKRFTAEAQRTQRNTEGSIPTSDPSLLHGEGRKEGVNRQVAKSAKRREWVLQAAFVVVTGASLYLHYQLVFVFAIIGLYHLMTVRMTRQWWRVALLIGAAGALFLPWVWTVITFSEGNTINAVVSMSAAKIIPSLLLTFSNNSVALLGLVVIFAAYKHLRQYKAILLLVAFGVVGTLAANAVYPFINQIRYIMFLWPLLAVVVGLGVERLSRAGVAPVVVLGIWVAAGLWTVAANDFSSYLYGIIPSWREFRATLEQQAQTGDVVAYHAGNYDWIRSLELDHYMQGLPLTHQMMEYIPGKPENNEYTTQARAFVADKTNVWVAVSHIDPSNFRLEAFQQGLMDEGFVACYTALDDESVTLSLETRLPEDASDMPLQFGDGIAMQVVEPVHADGLGQVTVVLGSAKADDIPDDQYSVAVHVVDAAGTLVAQADYGLPNAARACTRTLLNVPTGAYSLRVTVYNWQTGERLMGVDPLTGEAADRLTAAQFDVE